MGIMGLVTALAYRRIEVAGRLMVVLWVGMLITVGWVILAGLTHFDAGLAFDFPPGPGASIGPNDGPGDGARDRDVRLPGLLPDLLPG